MNWPKSFVQFVASPLMPIMQALFAAPAGGEHRNANDADCIVAAFAVSTGLIGLFCFHSTRWIHARLCKQLRRAATHTAVANAAAYFREALLGAATRKVAVIGDGDQGRECFGDGKTLNEGCRASLNVNGELCNYSTTSVPVSADCVAEVSLDITNSTRRKSAMQLSLAAQENVLEHSTLAIAMFDRDQKLISYNRTYAELWGLSCAWLDARSYYGVILDRLRDERKLPEQRNFPDWKKTHIDAISGRNGKVEETWHRPNGKSVRMTAWPHLQGGFILQFEDLTERLHWQAEFNLLTQVQRAILDTFNDGIAIFGTDGRLVLHNDCFAAMWKLSDSDLAGQPHFAEIADLCTTRIGHDRIWGVVSCGINSEAPNSLGELGKTKRADGLVISLALSRLPNGSTVVNFVDLTDLERFDELKNDQSFAIA